MNAMKIEALFIDFDGLGEDGAKSLIEDTSYPNHCMSPEVKSIEVVDVGEWSDGHPLNNSYTSEEEYRRIFAPPQPAQPEEPSYECDCCRKLVNTQPFKVCPDCFKSDHQQVPQAEQAEEPSLGELIEGKAMNAILEACEAGHEIKIDRYGFWMFDELLEEDGLADIPEAINNAIEGDG